MTFLRPEDSKPIHRVSSQFLEIVPPKWMIMLSTPSHKFKEVALHTEYFRAMKHMENGADQKHV